MKSEDLKDEDRFLLFMNFIVRNPAISLPDADSTPEQLVQFFQLLTGWEHSRALSAYEVGIVRGFFGQGKEPK